MTTRLPIGHTVDHTPAGRRAAQTAAALPTTVVDVLAAWLIDCHALLQRVRLVTQHLHEFLQLTNELVVVGVVSAVFSGMLLMSPRINHVVFFSVISARYIAVLCLEIKLLLDYINF